MDIEQQYFKFYNFCFTVKGMSRSAIYDLQRGDIYFIPNSAFDMLQENKNNKIEELFKQYPAQHTLVKKYLSFLIENELIFFTDHPENFPNINTEFVRPFLIDVLFIEIDDLAINKIEVIKKSEWLGCSQIVLVTYNELDIEIVHKIIELLKCSKVQVINIITKFSQVIFSQLKIIKKNELRIRDIIFFDSPKSKKLDKHKTTFSTKTLEEILSRRISAVNDFVLNPEAYYEALKYNLFYNRKVYITNGGEIKHYFREIQSYGNINSDKIEDIIKLESFQKLWNITKDDIEICKNCEFRYICPDNRIPTIKNNFYNHETECSYNPQTTIWKKNQVS